MEKRADHKIKTVMDFLEVPEDKVDACLSDFKEWIALYKRIQTTEPPEGIGRIEAEECFHWRDDDIKGLSEINLKILVNGKK